MIDPNNPHATIERAWSTYLLPVGRDLFNAAPSEIREKTVPARNALEASQHPEVRKLVAKGFYVVDTIVAGSVSSIVRQIFARARDQENLDERRRWENGENVGLIRGVVGSRPLGG